MHSSGHIIGDDAVQTAPRPPPHEGGAPATGESHLGALRGKDLGACSECGRPVLFEQNFMRLQGRVSHVCCPFEADAARDAPPVVGATPARGLVPQWRNGRGK